MEAVVAQGMRKDSAGLEVPINLSPLQESIYRCLLETGPQKALSIAKGLGKRSRKEVNPELYKMKNMNLLEHSADMSWTIKNRTADGVHVPKDKQDLESEVASRERRSSGTESRRMGALTEQQNKILELLHKNKPMSTINIARGVGRAQAKDVNPDLYTMEKMGLLKKEEHLWTSTSQKSPGIKKTDEATNQKLVTQRPPDTVINNVYLYGCKNIQLGNQNIIIDGIGKVDPECLAEYHAPDVKPEDTSRQFDSGIGGMSAQEDSALCGAAQEEELQQDTQSFQSNLHIAEEPQSPPHTSSPISPHQPPPAWDESEVCGPLQLLAVDEGDAQNASDRSAGLP